MQFKKFKLFFYFIILSTLSHSQTAQNPDFISPVDFPIYLSGNYGEIRSGHFHAGIDIKTGGTEGKKIYAIEDGFISRIKISANGYGKTIYLNHPSGHTSVYAHLSNFNSKMNELAKDLQYQANQFELNYFPKPNEIIVKKGDIIGFSGNTGSSDGPHLHFEIRESNEQIPLNPLLFNFNIVDKIDPVFLSLVIYPLSPKSRINGSQEKVFYKLIKQNGVYSINDMNAIPVIGKIGFGIEIYDYMDGTQNKCGIYDLSVYVDNLKIYNHIIDKIPFNESSYIESHIDYAEKVKSKRTIQKTFVAPNNKLKIYNDLINKGVYSFSNDSIYEIRIQAKDSYHNQSELFFRIKGDPVSFDYPDVSKPNTGIFMDWDTINRFETEDVKISIPAKCLFDTLFFRYSISDPAIKAYSGLHHIHNSLTPIHKKISISLKINELETELNSKAFIAQILEKGKIKYIGGEAVNEFIVGQAGSFGDFLILLDTISPKISPVIKNGNIVKNNMINIHITDTLSGIKSYNGYIDNEWALFEYDLKNDMLFYIIDEKRIQKNKEHELELFVMDNKGNVSTYYSTFYW